MKYLIAAAGFIAGCFIYQYFDGGDYAAALDRSYWSLWGMFVFWLVSE